MDDPGGVIVVGVDGSPGAAAALDFALAEGRARGCRVQVVTAWLGSVPLGQAPDSADQVEARARVEQMQSDVVARRKAELGEVPDPDCVVVQDYAGRVLVARSEQASMVVVGSGTPGSASQQVLGSVAEYCVRHARVPVVIVPAPSRLERRATLAAVTPGSASDPD
ncbi:MAG: universal stress protein [Nocardioides sp.]